MAMRIVILGSSLYSETACAMAVRLAKLGKAPVGALVLSTLNRATLTRKIGQWGLGEVARYARTKLASLRGNGPAHARNPHLENLLGHEQGMFRSLRQVAKVYGFPVEVCRDQNSLDAIACIERWAPDLMVFTGGNILRKQLLAVPRLGVLNVHLGLLPQIRGMSSPEWSLLTRVPVGITFHYMDTGIDTGPILRRYEFPDAPECESLSDLRNRLIAFGVAKIGDVVEGLVRGTISADPQSTLRSSGPKNHYQFDERQFFVMHEWLQARAAENLIANRSVTAAGSVHE
jgi:folate-dependent phosphoribosylglycinamide formyltransferase PurN